MKWYYVLGIAIAATIVGSALYSFVVAPRLMRAINNQRSSNVVQLKPTA